MSEGMIDLSALRRLLDLIGGDPEDLRDLLRDYQEQAPELASRIDAAARSGDLDALRIAAHTLKSNSRDFGATRLSVMCEELEKECRGGAVADPISKAEAIVGEEAATRQALGELAAENIP